MLVSLVINEQSAIIKTKENDKFLTNRKTALSREKQTREGGGLHMKFSILY